MTAFQLPDWAGVFVPDKGLVESFLRGSCVYLSLLVLFRVILKRQGGSIGLPDLMLVVLVSECVSPALSAEAKSVSNGLACVLSLLFWNYALDKLAHHWPWLERRLEPRPVQLVKDGQILRENLDAESMSDDELMAQLRQNGIDDVRKAKAVFIESEGTVSVIPKDEDDAPPAGPPKIEQPPEFDAALARFLAAAEAFQQAVAWHDERAAAHQAAAKAARELLTRHGVRPGRANSHRQKRGTDDDAEGAEGADAAAEPAEARPRFRDGPEAAVSRAAV
jgi:uncharacterized membrane protein YcaP (DUF421 family)